MGKNSVGLLQVIAACLCMPWQEEEHDGKSCFGYLHSTVPVTIDGVVYCIGIYMDESGNFIQGQPPMLYGRSATSECKTGPGIPPGRRVAISLGEWDDIHPIKNTWALANFYYEHLVQSQDDPKVCVWAETAESWYFVLMGFGGTCESESPSVPQVCACADEPETAKTENSFLIQLTIIASGAFAPQRLRVDRIVSVLRLADPGELGRINL